MSHVIIYESSNGSVLAYSREFSGHSQLWFENVIGIPMAVVLFQHLPDNIWEGQFPPTLYKKEELAEHIWILEKYLRLNAVGRLFGMANKQLGEFLISVDDRFYWEKEGEQESEVIVGNNTKRKLWYDFWRNV